MRFYSVLSSILKWCHGPTARVDRAHVPWYIMAVPSLAIRSSWLGRVVHGAIIDFILLFLLDLLHEGIHHPKLVTDNSHDEEKCNDFGDDEIGAQIFCAKDSISDIDKFRDDVQTYEDPRHQIPNATLPEVSLQMQFLLARILFI